VGSMPCRAEACENKSCEITQEENINIKNEDLSLLIMSLSVNL
jgi:hypothetical protein